MIMMREVRETHRNRHQLLDLLDLVPSGGDLQALEYGLDLGHRQQALLRRLLLRRALLLSAEHDLVLAVVVLIEQRLLVVYRARNNLHLLRVQVRSLLHLLQVLVVAVLR